MSEFPHLLNPDTLGGKLPTRALGRAIGRTLLAPDLEREAARVAAQDLVMPHLGVLVQARRRTTPKRLAARRSSPTVVIENIGRTLEGIRKQKYAAGKVRNVLVMIDEDLSLTRADKLKLSDVRILRVPRETNHAQALNQGVYELGQD